MRAALRTTLVALGCWCWIGLAGAQQEHSADAAKALLAVEDADPLELARVVRHYGDDAVLALLAADKPPAVRLVAMRAAQWLAEPELALALLAPVVATRDSDLAEAAARAALAIARGLDYDVLSRRERSPRELSAAAVELQRAARQPWVRADLRLAAAAAVAQLEAAGVPRPDAPK
jgi:hypothetical protein